MRPNCQLRIIKIIIRKNFYFSCIFLTIFPFSLYLMFISPQFSTVHIPSKSCLWYTVNLSSDSGLMSKMPKNPGCYPAVFVSPAKVVSYKTLWPTLLQATIIHGILQLSSLFLSFFYFFPPKKTLSFQNIILMSKCFSLQNLAKKTICLKWLRARGKILNEHNCV